MEHLLALEQCGKDFIGQVIFLIRNLLLRLVVFPQCVALRPMNFFSSAVILNLSLLLPKLKISVSETLSGGGFLE
jgi:hypothetical protein